ncbi:MAG: transposase, partial [Bacteroidales bacterium]|nr:transposase [Bacteroidales bacterium]
LKTFKVHYKEILNYFNNRSTNASAESFNAKIKYFRMMYRGVRDREGVPQTVSQN